MYPPFLIAAIAPLRSSWKASALYLQRDWRLDPIDCPAMITNTKPPSCDPGPRPGAADHNRDVWAGLGVAWRGVAWRGVAARHLTSALPAHIIFVLQRAVKPNFVLPRPGCVLATVGVGRAVP